MKKYTVVSAKWGYILGEFRSLKEASAYIDSRGMLARHKRGEFTIYAQI
jgi:hypothetical protein